jgi:hypothetical protein
MVSRALVPDIGRLMGKEEVGEMIEGEITLIGVIASAGVVTIDPYANILIECYKLCMTSLCIPSIL